MGRTVVAVKILHEEYYAFFKLIGEDIEFPPTYNEWLIGTSEENAKCRSRGDIIEEVEVHPKEFSDWSGASGLDPSLTSLRAFAVAKGLRNKS